MKANVFMILAAGLLLGACSNDNEPTDNANGVAAVFTTNLDGRVQTRMADEEWAEDDAIGIFSLNDEMEGGDDRRCGAEQQRGQPEIHP